jgi:hypothetical protein
MAGTRREPSPEKQAEVLEGVVQEKVDEETEKGYHGIDTDPTPNEHYTVAGVAAGKPTPETDPDQAAAVGSPKYREGGSWR